MNGLRIHIRHFLVLAGLGLVALLIAKAVVISTSAAPITFQEGEIELVSPGVCSPNTSPRCGPGPYTVNFQVPDGVTGVSVDVYWIQTGEEGQIQPNEHSYFRAYFGGSQLGEVYCQDFGDDFGPPMFCGSVDGDVSAGQDLILEIRHADEESGPTPGSHEQYWVINWIRPAPTATFRPTDTNTPSPTVTVTATATATATVTPTLTFTPTEPPPTSTPTDTPSPTDTPTQPPPPPTDTPTEPPPPTNTPTEPPPPTNTPVVLPPGATATWTQGPEQPSSTPRPPTATATREEPEDSPTPTRTNTPIVGGPAPFTSTVTAEPEDTGTPAPATLAPATGTPSGLLPQTGADLTTATPVPSGIMWKVGLVVLGLALTAFGLFRPRN